MAERKKSRVSSFVGKAVSFAKAKKEKPLETKDSGPDQPNQSAILERVYPHSGVEVFTEEFRM